MVATLGPTSWFPNCHFHETQPWRRSMGRPARSRHNSWYLDCTAYAPRSSWECAEGYLEPLGVVTARLYTTLTTKQTCIDTGLDDDLMYLASCWIQHEDDLMYYQLPLYFRGSGGSRSRASPLMPSISPSGEPGEDVPDHLGEDVARIVRVTADDHEANEEQLQDL